MKWRLKKILANLFLISMLAFSSDAKANLEYFNSITMTIQGVMPKKRILYVDEHDEVIRIISNAEKIKYKDIEIFRGKEKIKMNAKIDYQYNLIKSLFNFSKKVDYSIAPIYIPNPLLRQDGKPYSNLELKVIDMLSQTDVQYPCYQTVKALERSNINLLKDGDVIRFNFYPQEGKKDGDEQISIELVNKK